MALRAGYIGVKKSMLGLINSISGSKIIKSIGSGLSLSNAGELSANIKSVGDGLGLSDAGALSANIKSIGTGLSLSEEGVLSAQSSTEIITVQQTGSTNAYAWLVPKDADGNDLNPEEVTIISLIGVSDMAGSPPYYNGYSVQIDLNNGSPRYACKLLNSQTNGPASDGTYNVTYRVCYIPYPAVSNNNSRSKKISKK